MKRLALGFFSLLALGAVAISQTVSVPQVTIINPTDLFQVVPKGQPSAGNVYATPAQITSQMGYVKASPVTGFTYTFGNSQSILVLTHASLLASGTVVFASAPSDGAQECIWAQNGVTTLNLSKATGHTINNAVTTIAAASKVCYLFSLSNLTWDRD